MTNGIKDIQFNADRGRVAMNLVEKEFIEKYDVALIQEPYFRCKYAGEYKLHKEQEG